MANRPANYPRCRYCYRFRRRFRQRSCISCRHRHRFRHAAAPPPQSRTLTSPAPDTAAATDSAADITSAKATTDVPAHTVAHASDHVDAHAAAIAYAAVRPKLPFLPSSRSRAGSCCHRYIFVHLTICPFVRPSVRPHLTDSLSVRQTVSPVFGTSVYQSVSLSICTPVRLSTVRLSTVSPSVNHLSVNRRLSANRFYWEKKPHKKSELGISPF